MAGIITALAGMAAVIGCDQVSKAAARALLSHPVALLGGTLKLILVRNAGAFLGAGSGMSERSRFLVFSLGGSGVILAGLCYLFSRKRLSIGGTVALSSILGGAIGNQIDRFLFQGAVTDFLFLSLGPVHTGVFNVADMAIMFGAAWFLIDSWHRPSLEAGPEAPVD